MYGYIYKITNLNNGKCYIGKHKYSKNELDKHYITSGKYIKEAINKYGLESFKREIIDIAETLNQLNNLEIYYIEYYNSYRPNGYNLTKGGDGISEPSLEMIESNRQKHLGKKLSEETKLKIGKASKNTPRTDEWINNISKSLKGRQPSKESIDTSKRRLSGCKWYNDGENEFQLKDSDDKTGLIEGRLHNYFGNNSNIIHSVESIEKMRNSKKNQLWYNNGLIEKMFRVEDVPNEFVRGRLPLDERRKNICRENGKKYKGK